MISGLKFDKEKSPPHRDDRIGLPVSQSDVASTFSLFELFHAAEQGFLSVGQMALEAFELLYFLAAEQVVVPLKFASANYVNALVASYDAAGGARAAALPDAPNWTTSLLQLNGVN